MKGFFFRKVTEAFARANASGSMKSSGATLAVNTSAHAPARARIVSLRLVGQSSCAQYWSAVSSKKEKDMDHLSK
jgi:hypothetical protein